MNSFRNLGATLSKDGSCIADIHIRIATASMVKLDGIWHSNIRFTTKHRLYKSLKIIQAFKENRQVHEEVVPNLVQGVQS